MLGIHLTDADVGNVPLLDRPVRRVHPRPERLPQVVIGVGADGIPNTAMTSLIAGTSAAPIGVPTRSAPATPS